MQSSNTKLFAVKLWAVFLSIGKYIAKRWVNLLHFFFEKKVNLF